jgi:hypothetical protein
VCPAVACTGDRKAAAPFLDGSGTNAHDPYWATVSEVRELHMPASERSCVHVELDISGNTQLTYQTGVTGCSSGGGGWEVGVGEQQWRGVRACLGAGGIWR